MSEVKNKRILKEIADYVRATHLYFANMEKSYWYRESTNQWILEVKVSINPLIYITSRYPHRYRLLTNLVWVRQFYSSIREIVESFKFE